MLTELENKVLKAIVNEEVIYGGDESKGWGPELGDIVDVTQINIKILRGVLGSLTKKNKIELEPGNDGPDLYCSQFSFDESVAYLAEES